MILGKRTFSEIRKDILNSLESNCEMSINSISRDTDVNWRTVEKHLVYLVGRGYAKEVFTSAYVRIISLTDKGKALAIMLESEDIAI